MTKAQTAAPRASELACEATIIAAARVGGWLVHGTRTAKTGERHSTPVKGHAGFPDLLLCRGDEFLIVELKRWPNKVEPAQEKWLAALSFAGVDARVVYVPEMLDEFCQWLADRRPTVRQ